MPEVKLNIKLGALEVQFEGAEGYAEEHLLAIIERLSQLDIQDVVPIVQDAGPVKSEGSVSSSTVRLSTSDIAVRLGAKSGTDLVMAAAAYLYLTEGKEEFRRSDILTAMKSAKAFYKATYSGNLSKSLETLMKAGRLSAPGQDTFALPYAEVQATQMLL